MTEHTVWTRQHLHGVYRHYKGGRYRVITIAKLSDDHATEMVVYCSLTNGEIWTRPVSEWHELVEWPNAEQWPRYVREDALVAEESKR